MLFTPKYTRELINLGYHDADARIDEIEDYLFSSARRRRQARRAAVAERQSARRRSNVQKDDERKVELAFRRASSRLSLFEPV